MNDYLKKAFAISLGLTAIGKEKASQYMEEIISKGENASSESKDWVARLIQKGEQEQDQLKTMMQEQFQQMLKELPLATRADLEQLEQRVSALEKGAGSGTIPETTVNPTPT